MAAVAPRAVLLVARLAPLVVLAGCATPLFGEREASPEERAAYEQAANQAESDPILARLALERFLLQWPKGPLSDDAEFMLGEVARRADDPDAALSHYQEVLSVYRFGDSVDRARLRIAQIEYQRGDAERARSILDDLRVSRLPLEDQASAYRLLADTARDPVGRLVELSALRGVAPPSQIPGVDVAIGDLLVELDDADLAALASRLASRPLAARVQLLVADRALRRGDSEAAAAALARAERMPLSPRDRPLLISVRGRLRGTEPGFGEAPSLPSFAELAALPAPFVAVEQGTVGVVLPLTGPFARFGEASLHGALLAAGVFGDEPGAPRLRVRVRDSAGDPEQAARAVRELAVDEELVAVVGPMRSAACEAAAEVAEELSVPLLALTASEAVTRDRSYAFRLRTRPEEDIQALVDRSRATGAERFAILYRNDAYGLAMRALFWDAVERASGQIVGVAAYDPAATDFADPIRSLVGYALLERRERALLAERSELMRRARRVPAEEALVLEDRAGQLARADGWPLPPLVDFDALFIPDGHQNLVLIAPQLAFHEVGGARILAPEGAYDEELLRLAREHLRGALFSAHFFPGSPATWVRAFSDSYEASFGVPPDAFAAEAFDAVRLVALQLAQERTDRKSLRDGIAALAPYPGVSGVIGVDDQGHVRKRPFLLGVQRRRAVQLTD
ncbi:MAG: penicillin-binding protein activator [Myxococcota bacterium]